MENDKFCNYIIVLGKITCGFMHLLQAVNNAHDDQMTSAKLDNGPVDCTKDTEHQGLSKKSKLDQDSRY